MIVYVKNKRGNDNNNKSRDYCGLTCPKLLGLNRLIQSKRLKLCYIFLGMICNKNLALGSSIPGNGMGEFTV